MKKKDVLRDLKAVMFFDDNSKHCADSAEYAPTALIAPSGVTGNMPCDTKPLLRVSYKRMA
jgi:hypothetical protein